MKEAVVLMLGALLACAAEPQPRHREPQYSGQDITVVSPPQLDGLRPRPRPPSGYLKLHPVPGRRSFAQDRGSPPQRPRARPMEPLTMGERLARWFFSSDDDSAEATAPKPSIARAPQGYRQSYEKFPPFWEDARSKGPPAPAPPPPGPPPGHPPGPPPPARPYGKHFKHAKKDCNPCNSVPWIPMAKSSPLFKVPHAHAHHHDLHDSDGYSSSSQQVAVLPPAPVVEVSRPVPAPQQVHQPHPVHPMHHAFPDSTISHSYGLPVGNVPTGHGLLAPVNHLAQLPSSYGAPPAYIQPLQPIPFPQLSPVAIAPLHPAAPFLPESPDLVPPIPPHKTANVVFTISEDNQSDKRENVELVAENSVTPDQSSEPSSLIDSHTVPKQQEAARQQFTYQQSYSPPLDIVKSVPLVEYTSSIEYPLSIIQSPYIDVATAEKQGGPKTYEKESQTGQQKVSDIILGSKEDEKKSVDSDASGSIITELKDTGIQNYVTPNKKELPTTAQDTPTTPVPKRFEEGTGTSPFYIEVETGSPGFTYPQPVMHPFQNSFHQENGQLVMDTMGQQVQLPQYQDPHRDFLNPDILTPPPAPPSRPQLLPHNEAPHFNPLGILTGSPTPYLNPPDPVPAGPTKETPLHLPPAPSTTWLLPAQADPSTHWLLPATSSAVPHLFNTEQGIATAINGGLSPPPPPQPLNPGQQKPKKIQIIIPYTTINAKEYDQNTLDTMQRELYQALLNDSKAPLPESERAHTWMPIVVTDKPMVLNQGRKVPEQDFDKFKNLHWNEAQQSETRKTEMKHILATNIRELLSDEVEKPKSEQNIRLQKNIDNWTALEYSNHKVVAKKEPMDVISHAQAVTSIPGTSISHLLLPSKKIPTTFLTTTPTPAYDEPRTTPFSSSVSVNSRPFTYTTASMYSTVARNGLFSTTPKPTTKNGVFKLTIDKLEHIKQQSLRNSQLSSFANQENHRNGYTDVSEKWGKFRDNLVVPEDNSVRPVVETTTTRSTWADFPISFSPGTNEKVYVVTPVSSEKDEYKRTTRAVATTEKTAANATDIKASETSRFPSTISNLLNGLSYTKLEKVQEAVRTTEKPTEWPGKVKSTPLFRLKSNKTDLYRAKVSKFNKPKPIEKFFPTTKASPRNQTTNFTVTTQRAESASINDVFPFRNGGELPVEMSQANLDARLLEFRNTGERKTLIKQVKINRKQKPEATTTDYEWTTTEEVAETSTVFEEDLQVDVLLPQKNNSGSSKDSLKKKPSSIEEKKKAVKAEQKTTKRWSKPPTSTPSYPKKKEDTLKISPDEPNITDDEREKINNLPETKKAKKEAEETLLAVESKMPKGVFGATTKIEPTGFKPEVLKETIRLLVDFLEANGKAQNKSFKEHEKLLTGLESLTPVLSKAPIEQAPSSKNPMENLKSLENKLLKKLDKPKKPKETYMYNFPEYLISDLNLTKEELNLIEGAMVELRKNKTQKKVEERS